jgi:hypothetical protein
MVFLVKLLYYQSVSIIRHTFLVCREKYILYLILFKKNNHVFSVIVCQIFFTFLLEIMISMWLFIHHISLCNSS